MEGLLVVILHGHIWLHLPCLMYFCWNNLLEWAQLHSFCCCPIQAYGVKKNSLMWICIQNSAWNDLYWMWYNIRIHIHMYNEYMVFQIIILKFLEFLTNLPLLFKKTSMVFCLMLMYKMNVWYLNTPQSPGDSLNSAA